MFPTYTVAADQDLNQILRLQESNLKRNLHVDEQSKEGFVTVDHDYGLLQRMNSPYPHVITKVGDDVVGYCLVMLPELRMEIPILIPMFHTLENLSYQNVPLLEARYFIMGQVCIAKEYRGQGIFYGMYDYLKDSMMKDFDYIITEVSGQNLRSLKAHYNQGFKDLHAYKDNNGHPWVMVIWDIRNSS